MRQSWFGSLSLEARSAAVAVLALLLTTANAPAQSRGDKDRDDSDSAAASDRGEQTPRTQSRDVQRRGMQSRGTQTRQGNTHPVLGVTFYNDDANPLEIRRVAPGSPAEESGLERGDEILSVDGRRVNSVQQLKQRLDRAGQDQEIELGILRDGRQDTVLATLSSNRNAQGRQNQQGSRNQRSDNQGYARTGNRNQWSGNQGYAQAGNRSQWSENQGYAQAGNRNQMSGDQGYARAGNRSQWSGNQGYRQGYANQDRGYGNRGDENMEEGESDRPFLGIMLDEYSRDGVRVTDIYPDSPAEEAGLRPGDEIVAIDDQEVQSSRDLKRILSQKDADEDVTIDVDRNGRERTLRATLISQQEFVSSYDRESYRTGRRNTYGRQGYDGGSGDQDDDGDRTSRRRRQDQDQDDDD